MTERTNEATVASTTSVTSAGTTYRVQHTGSEPLSTTVAIAISDGIGVDSTEFQLYNYVDPDSLDTLFDPLRDAADGRRGWVELHVLGYNVSIYSTGEIEISTQEPTIPDTST